VGVGAEPAVEVSAVEQQEWHFLVFGFKNVIWTIPKHSLQRVSVMESTACTHQPWSLGHDIEGHQEGCNGMRSLPLIISSRKAMCCPRSHISMSACIRI
jgi:hypothetical protein